jgi:DUF4097 and DUF4098 domain-containing protein YvlB
MSLRSRRPSLLGGLLWTVLGLVFLLRNFGVGPDFWRIVVRYWPILLILLGLGKVIDYYRQREGVALRFGEVFGLLLLILFGAFVSKVTSTPGVRDLISEFPIRIGGTPVRIGEWPGNSYSFDEESTFAVAGATPLRIENSYGAVSVTPGSDKEIRVRLRKVVFHDEEARAKEIAREVKLTGGPLGAAESNAFLVNTNRDALASKAYRFRTDMEVSVPKKCSLNVRNAFGEVRVSNLDGKLDLQTTHKALDVRDCTGEIRVSNRYADSVVMNITGKVNLDARGRVTVETVKGDVEVRNEYSPTEIRDIDGAVTASTTESSIVVDKVTKPVVIDARGSQVTVQNVAAALKVTASHRRVKISDADSTVTLDTRYGGIELTNIKGNVEITSNSDRVNADDLLGALKARGTGTSFRINTVAGPVEIATTHKEVIVNDFSSSCKVTNEYADVTLASGNLPKGDIAVHNRNGEIALFLPEESAFQIEARTRDGRIDSNFSGLEPAEAGGERGRLQGRVRTGGPKVVLETEYSNIHVRTQESAPSRKISKPREQRPPRNPKDLREYSRRSSN